MTREEVYEIKHTIKKDFLELCEELDGKYTERQLRPAAMLATIYEALHHICREMDEEAHHTR